MRHRVTSTNIGTNEIEQKVLGIGTMQVLNQQGEAILLVSLSVHKFIILRFNYYITRIVINNLYVLTVVTFPPISTGLSMVKKDTS